MKKLLNLILAGVMACMCGCGSDSGSADIVLEDLDYYIIELPVWEESADGYNITGNKLYGSYVEITEEQKSYLDDGEVLSVLYEGEELFILCLSDEGNYELCYSNEEASEMVFLVQNEDGYYLTEISDAFYPRMESDVSLVLSADTKITATNYYAYVTGVYPEDEAERVWTVQKFFEDYVQEAGYSGSIRVYNDEAQITLEELYIP